MLNIEGNTLSSLPVLPHDLTMLRAGGNKISAIPLPLPHGITDLDFTHNYIISIPSSSDLPSSLESLAVNVVWLGRTMEDVRSSLST